MTHAIAEGEQVTVINARAIVEPSLIVDDGRGASSGAHCVAAVGSKLSRGVIEQVDHGIFGIQACHCVGLQHCRVCCARDGRSGDGGGLGLYADCRRGGLGFWGAVIRSAGFGDA